MNVTRITVDRAKARELYRKYKEHVHYQQPMDAEIQRAYQLIAQGRVVVQALASIVTAGLNEQGMPKLAIARADAKICFWRTQTNNGAFIADESWPRGNMARSKRLAVAWPGLTTNHRDGKAIPPIIPVHLRPRRGLANYHILWEAEWTPIPPRDPYLLRRVGGDLWLVVAAWDLTEVERAVMASRMNS